MSSFDSINGFKMQDLPSRTTHTMKEENVVELLLYPYKGYYKATYEKRALDVYLQGVIWNDDSESGDYFYNTQKYPMRSGSTINLQSHNINAYEFEVVELLEIDLGSLEIKVKVKLVEDFKLPSEFYIIWKQDEKYDNSYSFHSISNTLEEAQAVLLKEAIYGQVTYANSYFPGELIKFENKRSGNKKEQLK